MFRERERGKVWKRIGPQRLQEPVFHHQLRNHGGYGNNRGHLNHLQHPYEEAWKRLEQVSHTVFVDNLPTSMTKSWLWQLFSHSGNVLDIFISWKYRKTNRNPFAFVRYGSIKEAKVAIQDMHGVEIRGCKVAVFMAEFRRGKGKVKNSDYTGGEINHMANHRHTTMQGNHRKSHGGGIQHGVSYKEALSNQRDLVQGAIRTTGDGFEVRRSSDNNDIGLTMNCINSVVGEVSKEMMNQLERSVVGESLYPIDTELMSGKLKEMFSFIENVREFGPFKVLITFESKEILEDIIYNNSGLLGEFFHEIRKWTIAEVGRSRRVWVECFGIPLHAWSVENMGKIGEIWGSLICLDYQTSNGLDFSSAKLLLATTQLSPIQGNINLSINGVNYDIFVKETNKVFSLWPPQVEARNNGAVSVSSSLMESEDDEEISNSPRSRKGQGSENCVEPNTSAPTRIKRNDKLHDSPTINSLGSEDGKNKQKVIEVSRTVSLNDDRRTNDIICDLGLNSKRPNNGSSPWFGLASPSYSKPPGYENWAFCPGANGSSSNVPLPIQHEASSNDVDGESENAGVNTKENDEEQHVSDMDFELLRKEAIASWEVGCKIGLSTRVGNEELVIQAIMENRDDGRTRSGRRSRKKEALKKKKNQRAKGKGVTFLERFFVNSFIVGVVD